MWDALPEGARRGGGPGFSDTPHVRHVRHVWFPELDRARRVDKTDTPDKWGNWYKSDIPIARAIGERSWTRSECYQPVTEMGRVSVHISGSGADTSYMPAGQRRTGNDPTDGIPVTEIQRAMRHHHTR